MFPIRTGSITFYNGKFSDDEVIVPHPKPLNPVRTGYVIFQNGQFTIVK